MISNKFAAPQETTNFARAVYFLVTLLTLGISSASQAQMLDLGDLQKWKFEGISRESHKNHGCQFAPGELKRDPITRRFLQDYKFSISARGDDPAIRFTVLHRANIRLLSPATCPDNTDTCEFEFPVESMNGTTDSATEKYLVVLSSKENAATDVLKAEVYYYGEGTGRRRLYLDCSDLKRSNSSLH